MRFFNTSIFFTTVIYQIRHFIYFMCMNNFTTPNLQSSNTIRYILCIHTFCIEIHLFMLASLPQKKKKQNGDDFVKGEKPSSFDTKRDIIETDYCNEREIKLAVAYHFVNELMILVLYKRQPQFNTHTRSYKRIRRNCTQNAIYPLEEKTKRNTFRATGYSTRLCVCAVHMVHNCNYAYHAIEQRLNAKRLIKLIA